MIRIKQTRETRITRAGFTMIETAMVLLIAMITAAFALPIVQTTVNKYQLKAATSGATWAIQSTRFQALMARLSVSGDLQWRHGRTQSHVSNRQQAAREPPRTRTWAASVPLSGKPVVLGATDGLAVPAQRNGGHVNPSSTAPYTFTIAYSGTTETITVSNYGNIDSHPVRRPPRGASR